MLKRMKETCPYESTYIMLQDKHIESKTKEMIIENSLGVEERCDLEGAHLGSLGDLVMLCSRTQMVTHIGICFIIFFYQNVHICSKHPSVCITIKKYKNSMAQWYMPIISTLGRLRQEDLKVKARLGYIVKPCL